jgi:hypothetical protein
MRRPVPACQPPEVVRALAPEVVRRKEAPAWARSILGLFSRRPLAADLASGESAIAR